jgi:hypothetical protein
MRLESPSLQARPTMHPVHRPAATAHHTSVGGWRTWQFAKTAAPCWPAQAQIRHSIASSGDCGLGPPWLLRGVRHVGSESIAVGLHETEQTVGSCSLTRHETLARPARRFASASRPANPSQRRPRRAARNGQTQQEHAGNEAQTTLLDATSATASTAAKKGNKKRKCKHAADASSPKSGEASKSAARSSSAHSNRAPAGHEKQHAADASTAQSSNCANATDASTGQPSSSAGAAQSGSQVGSGKKRAKRRKAGSHDAAVPHSRASSGSSEQAIEAVQVAGTNLEGFIVRDAQRRKADPSSVPVAASPPGVAMSATSSDQSTHGRNAHSQDATTNSHTLTMAQPRARLVQEDSLLDAPLPPRMTRTVPHSQVHLYQMPLA